MDRVPEIPPQLDHRAAHFGLVGGYLLKEYYILYKTCGGYRRVGCGAQGRLSKLTL